MEHPLIGSIDGLTVDNLSSKISELHQKLVIAQNTGNGHLCNQIRMALETYQNKYQEKMQAIYKVQDEKFNTNIDIS